MIRAPQKADLDRAAEIWLEGNLSAHSFIPARYWRDSFDAVKGMLLQAEVYVCEADGQIQGFLGLDGGYVAGIFVRTGVRSRGIGRQLLDFAKGAKGRLTLHVYQKNPRAVQFYRREGFRVKCEHVDDNTGEKEYYMVWER